LTPTQIIRKAALKTAAVPAPNNRQVEYQDIEFGEVADKHCWLCGGETDGLGLPKKKVIKPTFMDIPLAAQASNSICPGCIFCLSRRELRNYSILANEGNMLHPSRPEIRELLLNPPDPPFVLCIAASGQKWVHIRSEIAYTRDNFPVQLEETRVNVNVEEFREVLGVIEQLYTEFSKAEIESGEYNPIRINKFGIGRFEDLEEKARGWRGSRLFSLAIFVAQKGDKE